MQSFKDYEETVPLMVQYPNAGHNLLYPALGLAGESGEYIDKIKKLYRNKGITDGDLVDVETKQALLKELGDVLWYVTAAAHELRSTLQEVAEMNAAKLLDRLKRDVIKSEGDNR